MDVRNVAVVGRVGAGKSELVAALSSWPIAGPIAGSNNATQPTTQLHAAQLEHRGVQLTLLDTPGHPDLTGALVAGLRAADAVLFVVPAVGGLDAVTAQVWDRCEGRPRMVAITQLDQPGADVDEAVALCQRLLDESVLPLALPMHDDDGTVAGLLSLLDLTVVEATGNRPADPEHRALVAGLRDDLLETVLAEDDDQSLLDRYLDQTLAGDEPEVLAALYAAVRRGAFSPAIVVSARSGVGVPQLLDLLVDAFPSPEQAHLPAVAHADGSAAEPLTCDPNGPLAAEIVAPGIVRVWSGTLAPDVVAGRVQSVQGLGSAPVGQSLSGPGAPLVLEPWDLPEPQLPVAVQAREGQLEQLTALDPTLRAGRDPDTGQQVLWCLGDWHAEVALALLPELVRVPFTVPNRVADGVTLEPWVTLVVEVPTVFARSVASDLTGRGARCGRPEPDQDDDEVSRLRAELGVGELGAWVPALAAASYGTARVTRTPLGWEPVRAPAA